MRVPRATYRLQLTPGFGFARARSAVRYLAALGISDLYLSPVLEARPGSEHGYDVTDPTRVRAELGGRRGLEALASAARDAGLGIVADIVPNHMAVSHHNPWLVDVLARGAASPHARAFDIDRRAPGADGRIVLPILGAPLEEALADMTIEQTSGRRWLRYGDHLLPLAPGTRVPRRRTPEAMARVLEQQHYQLVDWRAAPERANYRRFFDINELICVRVEDATVFERSHRLIASLARARVITGLRIDHIDGLYDPAGYLRRLARATGRVWVAAEKILAPDEWLPREWEADGTTGYDFIGAVTDLFIAPEGHAALAALEADVLGEPFDGVAVACKDRVLRDAFPGEVRALTTAVRPVARAQGTDDPDVLAEAIIRVTAHLRVYRTYLDRDPMRRADAARIRDAVRGAGRAARPELRRAIAVLGRILLLRVHPAHRSAARRFVRRWQQRTGPAAAKGVEDTALYRSVALVARNEVGMDPGEPVAGVEAFHARMRERLRRWPNTMNATSTHDTKRSEDVRARLAVLSEVPGEWRAAVERWRARHAGLAEELPGGPAPDARDELLAYQTIVGAWPLDAAGRRGFARRIDAYIRKAAREAKVRTSWTTPDERYERALSRFVRRVLAVPEFADDVERLVRAIAAAGAVNALAQVVLKIAAPGVPDVYQGTERWALRLVDPDNRAPVDLEANERDLARLDARAGDPALPAELLEHWPDGRIKLFVTVTCLRARARDPELFATGAYIPTRVPGDRVVAFARRRRRSWILAVVPRLTLERGSPPLGPSAWGRATLPLPDGAPRAWTDAFTGASVTARADALALADVFASFPVALLSADRSTRGSR